MHRMGDYARWRSCCMLFGQIMLIFRFFSCFRGCVELAWRLLGPGINVTRWEYLMWAYRVGISNFGWELQWLASWFRCASCFRVP